MNVRSLQQAPSQQAVEEVSASQVDRAGPQQASARQAVEDITAPQVGTKTVSLNDLSMAGMIMYGSKVCFSALVVLLGVILLMALTVYGLMWFYKKVTGVYIV